MLLIFSNSFGTFLWSGPNPDRTIDIEEDPREIEV